MMNLNKLKSIVFGIAAVFAATGCGAGASGKNVKIDGVTGPNVSYVNGEFLMSATLTNVNITGGVRVPIPNMPNSYVEIGPDFQSAGMLISVGLSAADLVKLTGGGINILPPQELPGGRALPGVSGGQLPSIAVQVPKFDNMVFYVGPNVFGVFVPVKMNFAQGYMASFRFYDSSNTALGTLSLVGEDTSGLNSGFLLLIPIKGQVANIMKSAGKLN